MTKSKRQKEVIDPVIGLRLKIRRMMLGISQKELGDAVNISVKQIQKYESSTSPIAVSELLIFAKLLDVPIHYFISSPEIESVADGYLFKDNQQSFSMVAEEGKNYSDKISDNNKPNAEDAEMFALIELLCESEDPSTKKKILKFAKSIMESEVQ